MLTNCGVIPVILVMNKNRKTTIPLLACRPVAPGIVLFGGWEDFGGSLCNRFYAWQSSPRSVRIPGPGLASPARGFVGFYGLRFWFIAPVCQLCF